MYLDGYLIVSPTIEGAVVPNDAASFGEVKARFCASARQLLRSRSRCSRGRGALRSVREAVFAFNAFWTPGRGADAPAPLDLRRSARVSSARLQPLVILESRCVSC